MPTFSFGANGWPAPQGSKSVVPTPAGPRAIEGASRAQRDKGAAWRADVIEAVARRLDGAPPPALAEPVLLDVTFFLPKPKGAAKAKVYVTTQPDLSKLVRAVEDALVLAGVLADDRYICRTESAKVYAIDTRPGALIELRWGDDLDG